MLPPILLLPLVSPSFFPASSASTTGMVELLERDLGHDHRRLRAGFHFSTFPTFALGRWKS